MAKESLYEMLDAFGANPVELIDISNNDPDRDKPYVSERMWRMWDNTCGTTAPSYATVPSVWPHAVSQPASQPAVTTWISSTTYIQQPAPPTINQPKWFDPYFGWVRRLW